MRALRPVVLVTILAAACDGGGAGDPDATAIDAADIDAAELDAPPDAIDAPLTLDATFDAANWIDPLDHSFGDDGLVTFDGSVSGLVLQPDQKLVIAGTRSTRGGAPVGLGFLERRLPSGELDPSFGSGGEVFPLADASGLARLTDGRLVVTGVTIRVFSSDGALQRTLPTTGGVRYRAPIALPDGGFAAVIANEQLAATQYGVQRYDAALALRWGSQQTLSNSSGGAATLARITAAGGDHLVLSTEGQLASSAMATGDSDGAFAGFTWEPTRDAVTLHDGTGAVAAIDALPGAMRVRTVTTAGALGPAVTASGCVPVAGYQRPAVARDASGRLLLAPWIGTADPVVSLVRVASTLDQLDPAWGCGRWFRVPSYCPAGQPCLGTQPTDGTQTIALVVAADGDVLVGGFLWRAGSTLRGFVARVTP